VFPHDQVVDAPLVGMDADRVAATVEEFERQQRAGGFPGGQIAVRRHGRLVVNAACGLARGVRPDEGLTEPFPATTSTLFPCFSAGKAVLAIVIAMLEEQDLLTAEDRIVDHFPEFATGPAAEEKSAITILDVLTHQGGILMRDFCTRMDEWPDWDKVRSAMINAQPTHRRGKLAYHPLEFGWLLAEVAMRVTGEWLPDWIAREIAGPCGLPGLRFGRDAALIDEIARPYWLGPPDGVLAGLQAGRVFEDIATLPELASAFIPGAGLVTDAATLAGFYAMLVGGGVAQDGTRILSSDQVRRYTTRHVMGWDRTNSAPIVLGRAFFIGTKGPGLYGLWNTTGCFGHAGAFCALGMADHETGLSIGVTTNGNRSPADLVKRVWPLVGGMRKACR